jgi:hypothetical protein
MEAHNNYSTAELSPLMRDVAFIRDRIGPEQTPRDLAEALSRRLVNEQLFFEKYIGKELNRPPRDPYLFTIAYKREFAHLLAKWMHFPMPFASVFDGPSSVYENMTSSDFRAYINEEFPDYSKDIISPDDIPKLLLTAEPNIHKHPELVLPERRGANVTRLVAQAFRLSEQSGRRSPQAFFYDHDSFSELMRMTLKPGEYSQQWQEMSQALSIPALIKSGQQYNSQYSSLMNTGKMLSQEEAEAQYLKYAGSVLEDTAEFNNLEEKIQNYKGAVDKFASLQLRRYWGDTKPPTSSL